MTRTPKPGITAGAAKAVRRALITLCLCVVGVFLAAWGAGTILSAPANRPVGAAPTYLSAATPVQFASDSGAEIHGWLIRGRKGAGAVILLHGVRGSRLSMASRARFLAKAGYSVLLFDFQAHGESVGQHITFGYLESKDVESAVRFVRQTLPGEKIGLIGVSLGGAAALLASPTPPVDALVLEMVYPDIDDAITDRLSIYLGGYGRLLTPLLTCQLGPRLGTSSRQLRPIDHVAHLATPKLFIVGSADRHTTLAESQRLYQTACAPKDIWVIDGAPHTNLYAKAPRLYERKVLGFLAKNLRGA